MTTIFLLGIAIGLVAGVIATLWWASTLPAQPASRDEVHEDRVRADSITQPLLAQANRDLQQRPRLRAVSTVKGS